MPWACELLRAHPWLEPKPQPPTSAPDISPLRALRVTPAPCGGRQPRYHGPGALGHEARRAPPDAIARGESFTPTRSARTPPVTGSWDMPAGETGVPALIGHERTNEPARRTRFRELGPVARLRGTNQTGNFACAKPPRRRSPFPSCDLRHAKGRTTRKGRLPRSFAKTTTIRAPEVPSIDGPRSESGRAGPTLL
jgi:hypothetical protein